MKKIFSIIILLILSQFQVANSLAADDGNLEISSKKNISEVKDCFESLNRGIFAFNQGLDKAIFKPLAKGYRKLPQPVRSGTSNALSNLGNVVTIPE
jgi:Surface lipoprotein